MAGRARQYRKKVLIFTKDGIKGEAVFDVTGKNKAAREAAENASVAEIKRMLIEDGCEFLVSVYRDEILKK